MGWGLFLTVPVRAESWQKLSLACGSDATYFNDVAIASSRTIYVAGGGALLGGPGIVCKSTDRGDNWVEKEIPVSTPLYAIDCFNPLTCYAAGAEGKILKTINGGDSWSEYTATDTRDILPGPDPQPTFWDIRIVPGTGGNTVVAIGEMGNVWRTTNGGFGWVGLDAPDIPAEFLVVLGSVHFSGSTGWIVGANQILKSTNGGASWVDQTAPAGPDILSDVFAITAERLWVKGSVDITRSDDGGESWGEQVIIAPVPFSDFAFVDENIGWAVGGAGGGIIGKTENGGIDWVHSIGFPPPEDVSVYEGETRLTSFSHLKDVDFRSANLGFSVGEDQIILRRYIPAEEVADLVPGDGWSLACANTGEYLHIIAGYRNNGPDSAVGPFVIRLESLDTAGNPIPGASRNYEIAGEIENGAFRVIDTIGGGAVSANELYALFNPSAAAEITIRMTVDAANNVTEGEAGETNNVRDQSTPCGLAAGPAMEGEPPSPAPPPREDDGFEKEKKKPSKKLWKKKAKPKSKPKFLKKK